MQLCPHLARPPLSFSDALITEFRDGEQKPIEVAPGQVDWDEPPARVHRGINACLQPYAEVTVFFLD